MATAENFRPMSVWASASEVTAYTSFRLMGRPRRSLVASGASDT